MKQQSISQNQEAYDSGLFFILTFWHLIDIMGRKTRYRLPEDSISRKSPEITVQWNHELNERDNLVSPDDYTLGSGVKAWWWCAHVHMGGRLDQLP